jgi:hypothetical protein
MSSMEMMTKDSMVVGYDHDLEEYQIVIYLYKINLFKPDVIDTRCVVKYMTPQGAERSHEEIKALKRLDMDLLSWSQPCPRPTHNHFFLHQVPNKHRSSPAESERPFHLLRLPRSKEQTWTVGERPCKRDVTVTVTHACPRTFDT